MNKIDWERAARDEVPCFFWNVERPENPFVCRLSKYNAGRANKFFDASRDDHEYCDFILDSDREKYTIKEPEYRACNGFDEFRVFLGKLARHKSGLEEFLIIGSCRREWSSLFEYSELLEPINGSKVIGVVI